MCDYSLLSFPNRLARNGEQLVVHRFACGAMGLASPVDLVRTSVNSWRARLTEICSTLLRDRKRSSVTAVCVPHGTRLLVLDIPKTLQCEINVKSQEEVTLRQLSGSPFEYRDAIRFRNGRQILLQKLHQGQRVRVLDVALEVDDHNGELSNRLGGWQPDFELEIAARVQTSGIATPGTVYA